jgi:hypothetical protein
VSSLFEGEIFKQNLKCLNLKIHNFFLTQKLEKEINIKESHEKISASFF